MFKKGNNIRIGLAKILRTRVWLIGQLKEYGIATDETELSDILKGRCKGIKANTILQLSEKIIKDHEQNEGAKPRQNDTQESAGLSER